MAERSSIRRILMNLATYIGGPIQTHAYRVLRKHVYSCLEQYDLTPTKWALLGMIFNTAGGIRASDAATKLEVKIPLITSISHELVAKGYVQRANNLQDKRSKLLTITAKGKKQVALIEATVTAHLEKLLQGVSAQEMAAYHHVLSTIIANDRLM